MSSNRDNPSPERRSPQNDERIVTDSIHGRMRPPQVFCEKCKQYIVGNFSEIEKHFSPTHEPTSTCAYCRGKVFKYIEITYSLDGTSIETEIPFHICPLQI